MYELRNEISIFLKEENHALATTFEDEVFLTQLDYLCDIFSKLNQLNITLQGKEIHLLQLHDKITVFKRKLQLWKIDLLINNEQCDSYSLLKSHFNSQSGNLSLQNTDECDMKTVIVVRKGWFVLRPEAQEQEPGACRSDDVSAFRTLDSTS